MPTIRTTRLFSTICASRSSFLIVSRHHCSRPRSVCSPSHLHRVGAFHSPRSYSSNNSQQFSNKQEASSVQFQGQEGATQEQEHGGQNGESQTPNFPQDRKQQSSMKHQDFGLSNRLWALDPSSPGSPMFLPAGAHIFLKLVAFLRNQCREYGFDEVLTPTLYKDSLWKKSGHWAHYRNDMFSVKRGWGDPTDQEAARQTSTEDSEGENYGLKPMNCPGHCLLYTSAPHFDHDLPIRYTEFSPLHRNEHSGSLSGLTRVRRFHQDDGHIFCRPDQIKREVRAQLSFMCKVYNIFDLSVSKIYLSTQPEGSADSMAGFLGQRIDFEHAEDQLKDALQEESLPFEIDRGEAAFYGPKIDVKVRDSANKEHQTATIQLDFQTPKRFGLEYRSHSSGQLESHTPVMIHRAMYGSVERFTAMLIEHYGHKWPFWLSPNQVIILVLSKSEHVREYTHNVAGILRDSGSSLRRSNFRVDIDETGETISKKILRAKTAPGIGYNVVCVIGPQNVEAGDVTVDLSGTRNPLRTLRIVGQVNAGALKPVGGKSTGERGPKPLQHLVMSPQDLLRMMQMMEDDFI